MAANRQKDPKITDLDHGLTGYNAKEVADINTVGGLRLLHTIDVADGATADIDVVLKHKTRIVDVLVQKQAGNGGASDTITVKNGADAISNAISINIVDTTLARAGTIDDAKQDVAAGGTLRIVRTKASAANVACRVTVYGYRIA